MKPVINLDELDVVSEEDGPFAGKYGVIGERIGAQKLGYNLTICPPGKKVCPFHNHRVDEEMFFILEGEGLLRFGDKEYPLRKHDIVACPAGGPDVAHQIVNTGKTDLKYLARARWSAARFASTRTRTRSGSTWASRGAGTFDSCSEPSSPSTTTIARSNNRAATLRRPPPAA
jgi:uncharacterized cupin superfamily protein